MTTDTFTANGTWVCPAGVTLVSLEMCGGGGSGRAGSYLDNRYGDGGSAGSYLSEMVSVTPGQSYSIIVGAGGLRSTANAAGNSGSASTALGKSASGGLGGQNIGYSISNGASGLITGGGNAEAGGTNPPDFPTSGTAGANYGGGGGGGTPYGEYGGKGSDGIIKITYVVLTPTITAVPTSGIAPLDVSFTGGVAGGSATSYDWDYGDGSAHGAVQNPTHQYTAVGTKTVTFTITGTYGSWSDTETITVYWQPSAHVFVISTEPWRH